MLPYAEAICWRNDNKVMMIVTLHNYWFLNYDIILTEFADGLKAVLIGLKLVNIHINTLTIIFTQIKLCLKVLLTFIIVYLQKYSD